VRQFEKLSSSSVMVDIVRLMIARMAQASKTASKPTLIGMDANGFGFIARPPSRDPHTRELIFEGAPTFRPNMTPSEVLQAGVWGGSYFRDIYSSVIKQKCEGAWRELPSDWIKGLNVDKQVASRKYNVSINKYKVNCGYKSGPDDTFGLIAWEEKGWIVAQDPYGWFQWYCRFFQGRRSQDDDRQISRFLACAGPTGRWRGNLCGKVLLANAAFDDPSVAPVVRQTLLHWAYTLSESDFKSGSRRVKRNGATYIPRSLMQDKVGALASLKSDAESKQVSISNAESKKRSTHDRIARALKRGRTE
jgi:hypothetical protein